MKLIIGIYDRSLSHQLAVALAGKKITSIEAEAVEEIPALLSRHERAMLVCEETNPQFYEQLKKRVPHTDIFLLYHPTLSTEDLQNLKNFGIKGLIPYSENAESIVETIIKYLSLLAHSIRQSEKSILSSQDKDRKNVGIHLPKTNIWGYGHLLGFNSSKVVLTIEDRQIQHALHVERQTDNLLLYLKGLNVRMYADLIYNKKDMFVFRYRNMAREDAYRLAYYIHYCRQEQEKHNFKPLEV